MRRLKTTDRVCARICADTCVWLSIFVGVSEMNNQIKKWPKEFDIYFFPEIRNLRSLIEQRILVVVLTWCSYLRRVMHFFFSYNVLRITKMDQSSKCVMDGCDVHYISCGYDHWYIRRIWHSIYQLYMYHWYDCFSIYELIIWLSNWNCSDLHSKNWCLHWPSQWTYKNL